MRISDWSSDVCSSDLDDVDKECNRPPPKHAVVIFRFVELVRRGGRPGKVLVQLLRQVPWQGECLLRVRSCNDRLGDAAPVCKTSSPARNDAGYVGNTDRKRVV